MTVKELMEILATMNPNAEVIVDAPYDSGYMTAGGSILKVETDNYGEVIIETEIS